MRPRNRSGPNLAQKICTECVKCKTEASCRCQNRSKMEVKTNKTLPDQSGIKRFSQRAIEASKASPKTGQIKAITFQHSNCFNTEAAPWKKPSTSPMAIEVKAENSPKCFSQTCKQLTRSPAPKPPCSWTDASHAKPQEEEEQTVTLPCLTQRTSPSFSSETFPFPILSSFEVAVVHISTPKNTFPLKQANRAKKGYAAL